mgnify:CR=1 FL=1
MAISSTFNQLLKCGVEVTQANAWNRGVAPSAGTYATGLATHMGQQWAEGGLWHTVITDGLPTLQEQRGTIFPAGHAGDRRINQQAPVQGRTWSEGNFSAPVLSDFLGVLLYAAMGGASTDMVPQASGASLLLSAEPISANPKVLVLNNQPESGGKILRFSLEGGIPAGTISISGIDAYGNGASEQISFGSGQSVIAWTRTAYSSIAASGISIAGASKGTVTLLGIKHYVHTYTVNSSAPTLAFERINNPTAGEASANNAFIHAGMVLKSLTLEADAEAVDSIFMCNADFEGEPTASSAETTVHSPSSLRIWPSWGLRVRRDNGTVWDVVQNCNLTMNTGNRNYRAAAGQQGPQGSFFGATEYVGDITILLNNELEYNKWKQASEIQMHWLWTSPWTLGASKMQLSASVPAYLENVSVADSNDAWVLTGNFRVVRNDNFPMSFQLINGTPGRAYGTGVI